MPQAPSSVAVRRVSSASTRSAAARLARARALKSSMLPIGVAMTSSLPAAAATIISTCPKERPGGAGLTTESSVPGTVPPMQSSLPSYRLIRLLGAALLFAALSACAPFPPARFPGATPGAATQAPAGERGAEAIALENAARQAPPGEQAQLELRAARAWLQAGRAGEAQRVLGALSTALTPVQNIERRGLDAANPHGSGRAPPALLENKPDPGATPTA